MIEGVIVHYARHIEDVLAVALPLLKAKPEVTSIATDRGTSAAA